MIINGTDRHVAYCRRVDTAPSIYLESGVSWFLLGTTTYSLPAVTCSDSEDGQNIADPVNNINSVVDVNTAGNYIVPCLRSPAQVQVDVLVSSLFVCFFRISLFGV